MKVFQVFESYPLFYQPYIPPVIDALCKKNGLDIKIVAFKGKSEKANEAIVLPKYNVRRTIVKTSRLLNKQYRGLDYLEITALKEKVAIIHLQHSFLFNKVINLLKRPPENRPKIIITLRGGDTYVKPWISEKWRNFYKEYGSKVDAFVVMSENQKNYLVRWGVPLANIHVIPISFGKKFTIGSKPPNGDIIKLVSIFRMCWEKNIVDNLKFVKALQDKNIPVTYDLFGDGPDLGQVYYLRDKFNLKNVTIHGKVSNEELKQKLNTFDFVLQLSLSESLGMSVIEAQSLGIPGIISNNGGLPEIIRDQINGVIVDLNDFDSSIQKVVSIWQNPSRYIKMSNEAIEVSHQTYSTEIEVQGLKKLYNNLVSTNIQP